MAIIHYKTAKRNRKYNKKLSKRNKSKHKSFINRKTFTDYLLKRTNFQQGGDLIPSNLFGLSYGNSLVLPQIRDISQIPADYIDLTKLKGNILRDAPKINVPKGYSGHLIMYDPDAPNPANNPHIFVHWIVKFNGNGSINTQLQYSPPTPPFGTHRYIFIFLQNNSEISQFIIDQIESQRLTNTNDIKSIIRNNEILAQFGYKVSSSN